MPDPRPVAVTVGGRDLIASGQIIISENQSANVSIGEDRFEFRFDVADPPQELRLSLISPHHMRIEIPPFTNPDRTGWTYDVGDLDGRPLFMVLIVEGWGRLDRNVYLLTYNFLLGERGGDGA